MTDKVKAKIVELVPELNGTHEFLAGYNHCEHCGVQKVIRDTQRKAVRENREIGSKVSEVTVTEHNMEGGPCPDNPRRPITLADVLRAIQDTYIDMGDYLLGNNLLIMRCAEGDSLEWNLTTDFDGQTDKVKEFIGSLLNV